MGNKINKEIQPSDINLSCLKNKLNIIDLKIGNSVTVPLDMLTNKKYDVSINIINEACHLDDQLKELGVVCQKISHNGRLLVLFFVPEYSRKLTQLQNFSTLHTLITKEDENKIYKYQKDICNRIWLDISEYCKMLNEVITKKINHLLLEKQQQLNPKPKIQKVKILADYYSSGEEGRYLYELGGIAIKFPILRRMILDKLMQESKHTRVKFKELKVKLIEKNKYMKFVMLIKIKKQKVNYSNLDFLE